MVCAEQGVTALLRVWGKTKDNGCMARHSHRLGIPAASLCAVAMAAILAMPGGAIAAAPGTLRLSDMPPGWQPLPSAPWTEGVCGFRFAPPVRADFIGPQPAIASVSAGARRFSSAPAAQRNLAFNLGAARRCAVDGYTIRVIAFPRAGDESFAMRLQPRGAASGIATMVFFRHRARIGAVSVVGHASSSFVAALARTAVRRLG